MRNRAIETWSWVLIFGGILSLSLGVFVTRRDVVLGPWLMAGGAAAVLAGAILVWVRSRRPPDDFQERTGDGNPGSTTL